MDLENYQKMVLASTSSASTNQFRFEDVMDSGLVGVNAPLLITACIGMSSEAGEFCEVVLKNNADKFHMKRELGDILWYTVNGLSALGFSVKDVVQDDFDFGETFDRELIPSALSIVIDVGAFNEIVKKVLFQGKPLDSPLVVHLGVLLGQVILSISIASKVIGFSFQEVLEENERKILARYPNGFEISRSEVREGSDI